MNRKTLFALLIGTALVLASCNQKKASSTSKGSAPNDSVLAQTSATRTPNTSAQILAKKQVPILCYHKIGEGGKSAYAISEAGFASHMKVLADSGYHSISPAQLYDYLVYNAALPEKPVMITFDDSRIEHRTIAAPLLEKYGFKGVFFIMTITYNKKNYMTTDQIAELAKQGHTVGLHTWDHTMVTKFKEEADWQKQIVAPGEKLSKIIGQKVEYIAYPNGVYNHESAKQMSKYMKLSFSLATKRDTVYPLQCVRRIITTEMAPTSLLKTMRKSFN